MNIGAKLYRSKHIIKYVFPVLAVLVSCLLLGGFQSLLVLISTNSMAGIVGTTKEVMCSGIAFFLLLLGAMGLYFWTRTDYKHYKKLWIVGASFIFISTIGMQWLFNYAYT